MRVVEQGLRARAYMTTSDSHVSNALAWMSVLCGQSTPDILVDLESDQDFVSLLTVRC